MCWYTKLPASKNHHACLKDSRLFMCNTCTYMLIAMQAYCWYIPDMVLVTGSVLIVTLFESIATQQYQDGVILYFGNQNCFMSWWALSLNSFLWHVTIHSGKYAPWHTFKTSSTSGCKYIYGMPIFMESLTHIKREEYTLTTDQAVFKTYI